PSIGECGPWSAWSCCSNGCANLRTLHACFVGRFWIDPLESTARLGAQIIVLALEHLAQSGNGCLGFLTDFAQGPGSSALYFLVAVLQTGDERLHCFLGLRTDESQGSCSRPAHLGIRILENTDQRLDALLGAGAAQVDRSPAARFRIGTLQLPDGPGRAIDGR